MKILKKITLGTIIALLLGLLVKLAWLMLWTFLFKLLFILKTLFMVGLLVTALYVLWKILGHRSEPERERE